VRRHQTWVTDWFLVGLQIRIEVPDIIVTEQAESDLPLRLLRIRQAVLELKAQAERQWLATSCRPFDKIADARGVILRHL
jgi:hypothetical protein